MKKTAQSISTHKPERKFCLELLELLEPHYFEHYSAADGCAVYITALYPNIELYSQKLNELAAAARRGRAIDSNAIAIDKISISIDRFLVSSDGYYAIAQDAVNEFRRAGMRLCEALAQSDTEEFGVHEQNLRVLTRLFINIRAITLELISVSLAHH